MALVPVTAVFDGGRASLVPVGWVLVAGAVALVLLCTRVFRALRLSD